MTSDRPATERERAEKVTRQVETLVHVLDEILACETKHDERGHAYLKIPARSLNDLGAAIAFYRKQSADLLSSLPPVRAEEPTTARECSCKGFCKGRDGLSSNYRCALDGKPGKVAALPPVQEPPKQNVGPWQRVPLVNNAAGAAWRQEVGSASSPSQGVRLDDLMTCLPCNRAIPDDANYCPYCGVSTT